MKLLIVDDETMVRQGLAGLLSLEPDFEIVGQASNGKDAVAMAAQLSPDVVLMDIQMPQMNGVEATKHLCSQSPDLKILMLTTFEEDQFIIEAIKNGARGYLLKDCGAKQLAAAIRSVAIGQTAIQATLGQKMLDHMQAEAPVHAVDKAKLSPRETDVLKLLGAGMTNNQIAQKLGITEKTVRDHVCNALATLNLRDRTQAALWARQHLLDEQ